MAYWGVAGGGGGNVRCCHGDRVAKMAEERLKGCHGNRVPKMVGDG